MKRLILLVLLTLMACQPGMEVPTSTAIAPAPASTQTEIPTPLPAFSPTPTLNAQYSIEHLRQRRYGGGKIELLNTMEVNDSFTRYLFYYPSDGLLIYGFANVPKGVGPFPVIVAIHGYVPTNEYQTLDYTAGAADSLADEGYIVLHPNLRNYPPSDAGDDLFRVGSSIDVLNLIELTKSGAGPAELFNTAARDRIGLWSHSMGGNIVLRVLTVSRDIQAAVLFASLSGDESKNFTLMGTAPAYQGEAGFPPELIGTISPANYYKNITSPVQLYHGTADTVVPFAWAEETCTLLGDAGVMVHCIYFPEEDHTFRSRVSEEFHRTLFEFYKEHLYP